MSQQLTKKEFLRVMKFPNEWLEWEMYPDQLFEIQIAGYEVGNEEGSEHDRYGAILWWIHNNPSYNDLKKLFKLTFLDPEQLMAEEARSRLRKCQNYNVDLEKI